MDASPDATERAAREAAREEARRAARLARAERDRERRARFEARLARNVLFAGEGVSAGLARPLELANPGEPNVRPAPAARGLPAIADAADLAALLDLDMRALRWLTFHREVAAVTHYRQFQVPKARGGFRTIAAPRPRLRAAQQAVRAHVLSKLGVTEAAQAFVPGRSTLTNARPHVGQGLVVKLDLKDFFGTITFPRVRGFFERLGYPGQVATLLALLTTESPRTKATIDGAELYVALGPRALPQGAPTSPEITNQIARRLDARLAGFARKFGWRYTRYADDLTFSRRDEGPESLATPLRGAPSQPPPQAGEKSRPPRYVAQLLGVVRRILAEEGFALNPDKIQVARRGRQQRVTGIVVNEKLGLPRETLRRFRATVHRISKDGFRDEGERQQVLGYAAYVKMVKPDLGARWLETLRAVPPEGRPGGGAS